MLCVWHFPCFHCQRSELHWRGSPWHSCNVCVILISFPSKFPHRNHKTFILSLSAVATNLSRTTNAAPSSALGLFGVAVHHLRCDALILLDVLRHSLTNQLEYLLWRDALGFSHFHNQHIQSQDSSSGDLHLGHHWLTQLEHEGTDRDTTTKKGSDACQRSLKGKWSRVRQDTSAANDDAVLQYFASGYNKSVFWLLRLLLSMGKCDFYYLTLFVYQR